MFIFSKHVATYAIWVIFWCAGMYLYNVPWQEKISIYIVHAMQNTKIYERNHVSINQSSML